MKSLKTKVIMSAFVLVFALIATIGSTYAWFTVSDTVNVNNIEITVETVESLLIRQYDAGDTTGGVDPMGDNSWTAANFSSVIDLTGQISATFIPLTALGDPTTANATDYTTISSENLSYITDLTAANRGLTNVFGNPAYENGAGYVELTFWLLTTEVDAATDTVSLSYTVTDSAAGTYSEAIMVAAIDVDNSAEVLFSEDPDFAFAFTSSDAGYNSSVGTMNAVQTIPAMLALVTGVEGTTSVLEIPGDNIPELVTIRIWIEGWDVDCTNALMGITYTIDLTFDLL